MTNTTLLRKMAKFGAIAMIALGVFLPIFSGQADAALVGWWKLDEASGTLADSAGSNNGTAYGGVTFGQAGKSGNALSFNGNDGYVETQSNTGITGNPTMSVAFWFKPASVSTNCMMFNLGTHDGSGHLFTVMQYNGKLYLGGYAKDSAGTTVLQNGVWYHVALSYDGTPHLYLNGQPETVGVGFNNLSVVNTPLRLGTTYPYGTYPKYSGLLDDVRIYNNALTAGEVTTLYQSYFGPYFSFTTSVQTIAANAVSSVITVQLNNNDGTPKAVDSDLTLNLTTSSSAGEFSLAADPFSAVTQATIPAGSSSVSFYYKDSTVGGPTITVSETPDAGYSDATQRINNGIVYSTVAGEWDGGGSTNNWSEAANWGNDTLPTSTTPVTFTATSTKNCVINTTINVASINIGSGYTGAISCGNNSITVNGAFILGGGTLNAEGSTINISAPSGTYDADFTGGTFNCGTGTVALKFASGGNVNITINWKAGSTVFNNLTVAGPGCGYWYTSQLVLTGTPTVNGLLTLNYATYDKMVGGTINVAASGSVTSLIDNSGGTTVINWLKTGDFSWNPGPGLYLAVNFPNLSSLTLTGDFKTSGLTVPVGCPVNLGSNTVTFKIPAGVTLDLSNLTINPGASTVIFTTEKQAGYGLKVNNTHLNNVTFSLYSGYGCGIGITGTLYVDGNLVCNTGYLSGGAIQLAGDFTPPTFNGIGDLAWEPTATSIYWNKTGTDTWTPPAGRYTPIVTLASGRTLALGTDITMIGLSLNGANFNLGNHTLTIANACYAGLTVSSGAFNGDTGKLIFNAFMQSTMPWTPGANSVYNNVDVYAYTGYGGLPLSVTGTANINGVLTLKQGGYLAGNYNLTGPGNVFVINGGQAGSGIVTMNGVSPQSITATAGTVPKFTVNNPAGVTFYGAGILQNISVNQGTTLSFDSAATFTLDAASGTVTNNGTIITPLSNSYPFARAVTTTSATSEVQYTGAGAINLISGTYGKLTLNNTGSTYTLPADTILLGDLNLSAGTLDASASNYALTVNGNWINNGTFNARSGTVTLNGSSQSISGTNTFYNLSKSISSAYTFTLPAGLTTTVGNSLTFAGAQGNLLYLRSSSDGTQAKLTLPLGKTQSIDFVNVKDIDSSAGQTMLDYGGIDADNNLNWSFLPARMVGSAGLVGYWRFENDVIDYSGNGKNGTAYSATYAAGRTGQALSLSGSTYVTIPINVTSLNNFTCSGWMKDSYPADGWGWMFGETTGSIFVLGKQSGSNSFHINISGVGSWASWGSGLNAFDGNWHHVAWTYDRQNIKLYVDGNFITSTAATGAASLNSTLQFGRRSNGEYWRGAFDDFCIYNRALSAAEVLSLKNNGPMGGSGVLTLKDPVSGSTAYTNSTTVTASFSNLEATATAYVLSNVAGVYGTTTAIPATPAFNTTWTIPSGDGNKLVYGQITSNGANYNTSNMILLDTTPPTEPTGLVLTANSEKTAITATVTAPANTDISNLVWRYNAVNGNAAPNYPSSPTAGTAFGAGTSSSVTASSTQELTASGLTQLKTYCVSVWAKDKAGNISAAAAQNYLFLSPPTPRLVITAPSSATSAQAGANLALTITAKDANNNIISDYAGPYNLTWTPTGASAVTLTPISSTAWASGVTTATINIGGSSAGQGTLTAIDTSNSELTNGTLGFTFYPASFGVETTALGLTAGKPFNLTVTAKDALGQTVNRYYGALALSIAYSNPTTGALQLSQSSITASNFASGVALISVSYPDAGKITITAKDTTYVSGVTIQGTSQILTFSPTKFYITIASPPGGRAAYYIDEVFPVTVTAQNYSSATTPNYQGTTTFLSQSGFSKPSDYAFNSADKGTHIFADSKCTAAGSFTITANDKTNSNITGISSAFNCINAKLIIPSVSGAAGTLAGGCYILNTGTNQVVASDKTTTITLSKIESVMNSTSSFDKTSLVMNNGTASFNLTDPEAETVTVSAVTNPVLLVQQGIFTFGSSSSNTFRIEYNFEVTNYAKQVPSSYTVPTTPTNGLPATYNQSGLYETAVSTGFQSYSKSGQPNSGTLGQTPIPINYTPTKTQNAYPLPRDLSAAQGVIPANPKDTNFFSSIYEATKGKPDQLGQLPDNTLAEPPANYENIIAGTPGMFDNQAMMQSADEEKKRKEEEKDKDKKDQNTTPAETTEALQPVEN